MNKHAAKAVLLAAVLSSTGLKAQTDWTHVIDQPVLDYGAPQGGKWDDGAVLWPTVIKDGDTLRMWYAGGDDVLGFGTVRIGYAWSLDGILWNRYGGNPVLSAELSWEGGNTATPAVIKDENGFKMWYGAVSVPPRVIGCATSDDGVKWRKHPDPVIQLGPAGDWDSSLIGPGSVIKENNMYKMWYWGGKGSWPNSVIQIGFARSDDGITWIKHDDPATTRPSFAHSDPILKIGGSGEWDELRVWSPSVLATDAGYEMWYAGRAGPTIPPQWVGYATSPDGVTWQKFVGNPVIDTQPVWGLSYLTSAVRKFDGFYHLWFTSFTFAEQGQRAKIGYARSPDSNFSGGELEIPASYFLWQNYPNPFNRSTTLRYGLPERAAVRLVIYDTLGRHVKTLVQRVQEAGYKSVNWNGVDELGRPVSTGVYLYRIDAGIPSSNSEQVFTQTHRMLLLK